MSKSYESVRRESFYARFIAWLYDPFMRKVEERVLRKRRRRLLKDLRGQVLEIGAGTGVNVAFYEDGVRLIATEPAPSMLRRLRERLQRDGSAADVRTHALGVHDRELDAGIPDGSLDAVVCTLVLCTVPDHVAALDWIARKLKRGGKLVLLEHVRSHGRFTALVQDAAAPVWRLLAEGCCLNRATDVLVREHGAFVMEREEWFSLALPFYLGVGKRG